LAAQLLTTIIDMAVDSGIDELGFGMFYAVPNMLSDFASLVKQWTAMVHTRDQILTSGFAPADFSHPFGIMRSPVVLPDLVNGVPQIPTLLPPPRTAGRVPVAI
jgi:hypothetical protein